MSSGEDGEHGDDPSPRWRGPSPGWRGPSPASRAGWPAGPAGAPARARHSGTRRRSTPPLAQRELMARITAGRRARQQRALAIACGAISVVVLLVAGSSWALISYINDHVGRVNAGTPSSGPLNILVAGVDLRSGLSPAQQARLHVGHAISSNSDTMMIVHVPADHSSVSVVSLPRDSWVDIPGHGMNKIN